MFKLARRARGYFVTLIEIRVHLIRVKPGHISSLAYSTLVTRTIKACTVVNSSLFSSKYFHFYNVKAVAKASSNSIPQHHTILPCLALCKPPIPLVSHISALLFKQVPWLTLFKIAFFPPSHPTGSFVFFNCYGCALSCKFFTLCCFIYFILVWFFCLIVRHIISFRMLPPFNLKKKKAQFRKVNPTGVSFYSSYLLIGGREVHPWLHFTPQYVGQPSLAIGPDCLLQDGTTHHLTYSPSRRAPLFWSTLCYILT